MGVKTEQTGENKTKHLKTVEATIDNNVGMIEEDGNKKDNNSSFSTSETLDSILTSIESIEEEWPQKVYLAVLNRFGRMPRGGWKKANDVFCRSFLTDMEVQEFISRAKQALTSNSGKQYSAREYKLDNNKRRKTETVEKECSLLNGKILLDTLNVFKEKLAILNKTSVEKMERTRKIPLLKVDSIKLDATIKAVQDHVSKHPPHSMSEIARILQAAQICYQETTRKDAKPSKWVESIKCKISLLESKVKLLEKVRAFGKLSAEEKRDAKKYMREVNMLACLHQDTSKAIAIFSERAAVYSKKLEVADRRREYRVQNQSFELYRSNFYRKLGGAQEVAHNVSKVDISNFWSTMWNRNDDIDTNKTFDAYLMEYVPDTNDQEPFPTYAEFIDIIKYLPNWKAAGCDGIYNFFIKKCESIHPFLYNVIKEICLKGENPEPWFYKGLTYLIPKGVPTRGSDF
ncbi:hypothetical protein NAPIS_ORF01137 [Vairimorpha apis BRL 01]|uniref:Reverse transcriptase n=1 Tax=Vairimorpha apis BRL 01 TaxID=1037528 RepID=T0L9W8_9MICR|nr:hypothetical protein NAPIS_ORF01137 [Vairimorpha apis BRL 01]